MNQVNFLLVATSSSLLAASTYLLMFLFLKPKYSPTKMAIKIKTIRMDIPTHNPTPNVS